MRRRRVEVGCPGSSPQLLRHLKPTVSAATYEHSKLPARPPAHPRGFENLNPHRRSPAARITGATFLPGSCGSRCPMQLFGRSFPAQPRANRSHLVLYTRAGCHLCAAAKALLERYQRHHHFDLHEIDIDTDPRARGALRQLRPGRDRRRPSPLPRRGQRGAPAPPAARQSLDPVTTSPARRRAC